MGVTPEHFNIIPIWYFSSLGRLGGLTGQEVLVSILVSIEHPNKSKNIKEDSKG
jgi:hypothetical protein